MKLNETALSAHTRPWCQRELAHVFYPMPLNNGQTLALHPLEVGGFLVRSRQVFKCFFDCHDLSFTLSSSQAAKKSLDVGILEHPYVSKGYLSSPAIFRKLRRRHA